MSENDYSVEQKSNLKKLSFEEALNELEKIVSDLEKGDVSLDDAINAYSRGIELKGYCQLRLDEAKLKVEKIRVPEKNIDKINSDPFET